VHPPRIIQATAITLEKREGLPQPQPPLRLFGPDAWGQANAQLQRWSTFTNRRQKVRFTVAYADGRHYIGQLELPWCDRPGSLPEHQASLGAHVRVHLERYAQWPYWSPAQCAEARRAALAFLGAYEIGGPDEREATRETTRRVQGLDFSAWPLQRLPSAATRPRPRRPRERSAGDQHTNEP